MDRDRDAEGRARNARARDELGRPLPRGVPGVEPIPDDLTLPPEETLRYAQELLDMGRPFQAHEVLEAAWKQGPDSERDLWQGLAQIAVAVTHVQRGNYKGAITLFTRARDHLATVDQAPYGIDLDGLLASIERILPTLSGDGMNSSGADQFSREFSLLRS